ncbi:unnamed protein product [Calypogeia fissa]
MEFRKLYAALEAELTAKERAKASLARRVMLDSQILRAVARQAERNMEIAREEFEKEEKEKQWNTMYIIGYNEEELKRKMPTPEEIFDGVGPQVQDVRPTRRPNADEGENNHFFFGSLYEMVERDQKNFTHWIWVGDRWEGSDI